MPTCVLRDRELVLVATLHVMRDVLRPVVGSQAAVYGPIELEVVGDADGKVDDDGAVLASIVSSIPLYKNSPAELGVDFMVSKEFETIALPIVGHEANRYVVSAESVIARVVPFISVFKDCCMKLISHFIMMLCSLEERT